MGYRIKSQIALEKIAETNLNIENIGFLLKHIDLVGVDDVEITDRIKRVGKIIQKFSEEIFEAIENQ